MPDPAEASHRIRFSPRRTRALLLVLAILLALFILFLFFTNFYTDLLWFRSIHYSRVFVTELVTKVGLFLIFGLLMGLLVGLNGYVAYRLRPAYLGASGEQRSLDRYRDAIEPWRRWVLIAVAALIALIAGTSAAGEWRTYLQWMNATPFGAKDPQFGRDIGFYVFSYPWWRFLVGYSFTVVVLSLLMAAVTHYLYGGLRVQPPGSRATPAAQAHLSLLLGLFVLLKAVAYWLDRYGLAVGPGDLSAAPGWTGLKYKDVNAVLPAKSILCVIALICAVLFFANVFRRTWLLPGIGFGLLVLSAVLIGGLYPAIVQQFQVKPSEADKEAPYISRNIQATRQAYGISGVTPQPYNATTNANSGQLANDVATTTSIRLMDPNVVSPTFQQFQGFRGFYSFPQDLNLDRYQLGGTPGAAGAAQDTLVAVRELNLDGLAGGQRNWINDHIKYTHGYGFVAARGNARGDQGEPVFVESGIPPTGQLGVTQPRVYFGEQSPDYSIVGGKPGSTAQEIDYPDANAPGGQRNVTYDGSGGVPIGSTVNRLLYATKFSELKILLSGDINSQSKILYNRDPKQRVEQVAPWLSVDGDPYPAVVNGRIVWLVDGYTTTDDFPYSARTTLGDVTQDSLTNAQRQLVGNRDEVNYIRNSVKATVDAYDGTVTLYAWQPDDPVLRTWEKAFPGSIKPISEMSPALRAHLRYPQDLFKVQRDLLTRYHVTNAQVFYSGQEVWRVPADPTSKSGADQPPYYLTVQMPGQGKPAFSLTTTLVPVQRPNLSAFVAVDADPGPDYGTMRVLQLPPDTAVPGPGQVQNKFESDPDVSKTLSLLRGGGSAVVLGNLLTLPVGGGLLYVEPVYVQANSGTQYPLLRKVLVAFGNRIAFEDTLQAALDQVFSGNSGAVTPGGGTGQAPPGANADLKAALAAMQQAVNDAQTALAKSPPDFAAYGAAQQRLQAALQRAIADQNAPASPTPGASPAPSAASPAPGAGPSSSASASPRPG
jgi:uncharacterized membrane protein (UPF0182 family)